ncbi:3-beta-hydroxysteroid-Delta(8),Delta(7)-isomerase 1 [Colletotrichum chlorophyti]|uniref:3-beta-hydroxysteroid-Delta(8), Delta(7)-isomerase 1 n=1 Tax=Colletotrichum chlorophyti TaxID=708187 RepID=A0A1Q8S2I7_9PEZI|nr:3-beta-hydroxysteroid-Delta(8),Delta(7)-isomerase 1 [Colletotrichum chlorophyti]
MTISAESIAASFAHPYYPVLTSLPHYAANETPLVILLASFASIIALVVGASVAVANRANPKLKTSDQLSVAWFSLCGFLHLFFEGYFILNHKHLASLQTLFGQLWKEYALSDSRYLISDPFMLCVESFTTVVWGPLCWTIVYSIAKRSHLRHPLQTIMCVGHLYGVVLYYSTSLMELYSNGVSHSRPEFLYFWVYYVGFNGPWVIVPAVLLWQSVVHIKKTEGSLSQINGIMGDKSWQYVPQIVDVPVEKKDE